MCASKSTLEVRRIVKRRFVMNDQGLLVDRDGVVLGMVEGLTLNMPSSGGKGEGSSILGSLPQIKRDSPLAPGVEEVWAEFVEMRERENKPLRSTKLTPSTARMISKGLKEVDGPADLMRAILGLVNWRAERGGSLDLSRILKTHPNGNSLADQIEFFISRAGEAGLHGGTTVITPDEMVKINRLKDTITQGYDKPHCEGDVWAAAERLRSMGWTVSIEPGSRPEFTAP